MEDYNWRKGASDDPKGTVLNYTCMLLHCICTLFVSSLYFLFVSSLYLLFVSSLYFLFVYVHRYQSNGRPLPLLHNCQTSILDDLEPEFQESLTLNLVTVDGGARINAGSKSATVNILPSDDPNGALGMDVHKRWELYASVILPRTMLIHV